MWVEGKGEMGRKEGKEGFLKWMNDEEEGARLNSRELNLFCTS